MKISLATFSDMVGIPYIEGGRSKMGWDCLGVLIEVYSRQGIDLPPNALPESGAAGFQSSLWTSDKAPWVVVMPRQGWRFGDAIVTEPDPGKLHVDTVIMGVGSEPTVTLTATLARGCHARFVRRLVNVRGVYRLREPAT